MHPGEPSLHVWTEEIMGIPASIHVRSRGTRPGDDVECAVRACFDELHLIDRVFSTYRPESDIRRIQRGELTIAEADPHVAVVEAECRAAELETGGLFSAFWRGWFDPTGYVKGWATENAARRHLAPLIEHDVAVGINVGGDMQLFTAQESDWCWNVAIADPHRASEVIATFTIANGAVATSGTAERGPHIVVPHSGLPAVSISSATVIADGLTRADLWATTAMVAGFDDRSWIAQAGTRAGLVVAADGRTSQWLGGVTVDVVDAGVREPGRPVRA